MNHHTSHHPSRAYPRPDPPQSPRIIRVVRRTAPVLAVAAAALITIAGTPDAAFAAPADLDTVINNIRTWLLGILVAVATLFLTVGGLRYAAANGDPGEVEKAKTALKSAAIGYGLALLAPLFVTIVGQWVK